MGLYWGNIGIILVDINPRPRHACVSPNSPLEMLPEAAGGVPPLFRVQGSSREFLRRGGPQNTVGDNAKPHDGLGRRDSEKAPV